VKTQLQGAAAALATAAALVGLPVHCALAQAASEPAAAPVSAAKKELVAKIIKLQQPGVENLARQLVEQPVLQLSAPVRAEIGRLPQDKREAVARQIEADVRRYADEAMPIVRDRAMALAPATLGPMIEQRFTEDELRQLVSILESPVNARYQALGMEMQRALAGKIVAETRAAVEPKAKALEQGIQSRLRAAGAGGGAAGGASGASGRSN
jgi:hypothetical protein